MCFPACQLNGKKENTSIKSQDLDKCLDTIPPDPEEMELQSFSTAKFDHQALAVNTSPQKSPLEPIYIYKQNTTPTTKGKFSLEMCINATRSFRRVIIQKQVCDKEISQQRGENSFLIKSSLQDERFIHMVSLRRSQLLVEWEIAKDSFNRKSKNVWYKIKDWMIAVNVRITWRSRFF